MQLTILIILRIVVDCGPLGNHVNGQVNMSSETIFMSTATYTCNASYNLIGPISRTCGSDGVWSPAAPTCDSKMRLSVCICACFIIKTYGSDRIWSPEVPTCECKVHHGWSAVT